MQHKATIGGKEFPLQFTRGDIFAAEMQTGVKLYGPGAQETWGSIGLRPGETPEEFSERFTTDPAASYRLAVILWAAIGERARKKFGTVEALINAATTDDELFTAGFTAIEAAVSFFQTLTGETTETETPAPATTKKTKTTPALVA